MGGGEKGSKDNAPALVSRYRRGTTPTLASLRVRSRVKLAARLGLRGRGAMERAGEGGEDSSPLETRKVRPVVFAEHQGGGGSALLAGRNLPFRGQCVCTSPLP